MSRAAVLLLAVIAACSSSSAVDERAQPLAEPPKDAIAKTADNGPVKVEVRVWPAKPTLDDAIYLRLDITAPAGIAVDAPFQQTGEQLGRFRVVEFAKDAQPSSDGGQHHIQTYTLEAASSGRHRVPPLRLEMTDSRAEAKQTGTQEILTEEIPLEIEPVKEAAVGAELKPATGALDPDVGGTPWSTILLIVSIAMVLAGGSVVGVRAVLATRRRAAQRSAYDDAIAKLRALESRGAPSADEADSWFVELSAIVRTYLERRYEIRAPELTTEEFLQEAARAERLTSEHRGLLSSFLDRCDRVKFAGYRPDAQESIDSLAGARVFVEDTRVREQSEAAA
jgi:hypothetical protein